MTHFLHPVLLFLSVQVSFWKERRMKTVEGDDNKGTKGTWYHFLLPFRQKDERSGCPKLNDSVLWFGSTKSACAITEKWTWSKLEKRPHVRSFGAFATPSDYIDVNKLEEQPALEPKHKPVLFSIAYSVLRMLPGILKKCCLTTLMCFLTKGPSRFMNHARQRGKTICTWTVTTEGERTLDVAQEPHAGRQRSQHNNDQTER